MKKIILISFLGFVLVGCGGNDECAGEIEAFVMSQKAVRNNLKSPSTADFPSIADRGVSVIGDVDATGVDVCKYQVIGYVDAQNSFGGMVRSKYIVGLDYKVKTKKWNATSVSIE